MVVEDKELGLNVLQPIMSLDAVPGVVVDVADLIILNEGPDLEQIA